ncbi:MAG: hypothetical protein ABR907_00650 [Terracidiphilus sp.]
MAVIRSSHSKRLSLFAAFSRSNFSQTASETATTKLIPLSAANSRTMRLVSSFYIFRLTGFHLSTVGFYHSTSVSNRVKKRPATAIANLRRAGERDDLKSRKGNAVK